MKRKLIILFLILSLMGLTLMNIPTTKGKPAYENFDDYTEVDPNSHITKTSTRITVAGLLRSEHAYVYKDKGENFFSGDFVHWIDVYFDDSSASGAQWAIWVLGNGIGSRVNIGDCLNIFFVNSVGVPKLTLEAREAGYPQDTYIVSYDTLYYLIIERIDVNVTCKIYSDSGRTDLLDTLAVTQAVSDAYRYVYGCSSTGVAGSQVVSGYCENLDLNIPLRYVTFYWNVGGILRVNNGTITNGTQNGYDNGTVIELISIPHNSSYVFSYFEWDSSNSTTNPYDLTITSNLTVWLYFSVPEVEGYGGFVFLFLGLIIGLVIGVLVGSKK